MITIPENNNTSRCMRFLNAAILEYSSSTKKREVNFEIEPANADAGIDTNVNRAISDPTSPYCPGPNIRPEIK